MRQNFNEKRKIKKINPEEKNKVLREIKILNEINELNIKLDNLKNKLNNDTYYFSIEKIISEFKDRFTIKEINFLKLFNEYYYRNRKIFIPYDNSKCEDRFTQTKKELLKFDCGVKNAKHEKLSLDDINDYKYILMSASDDTIFALKTKAQAEKFINDHCIATEFEDFTYLDLTDISHKDNKLIKFKVKISLV